MRGLLRELGYALPAGPQRVVEHAHALAAEEGAFLEALRPTLLEAAQHLDLVLTESEDVERLPNSARGVEAIVKRPRPSEVQRVVVESTGGYERRLVASLEEVGIPVALVNPCRVRCFGEELGLLATTDPIDVRLLARFARQAEPAETAPRSRESC